jgi:outer membrane protein OmpA-like peptidoglycan-associated protein
MRLSRIAVFAITSVLFTGIWGCSKSKPPVPQEGAAKPTPTGMTAANTAPPTPMPTPSPTPTVEPAAVGPVQNIAAAERGGEIESTGEKCAFNTNLLIDKRLDPVWSALPPVQFPQEFVLSFFDREPSLITSVVITQPKDLNSAPKEVEVWTSDRVDSGFKQAASQTLPQAAGDQTITFSPLQARYVKLRVVSSYAPNALQIGKVQILEGDQPGYLQLATRNPEMVSWAQSPRFAAQKGADWLQTAAVDWQRSHTCFGCHVQSQVIMGLAVAEKGKYVVNRACLDELAKFTQSMQHDDGTYHDGQHITATSFASMALGYYADIAAKKDAKLTKGAEWLLKQQQKSGEMPSDHNEPPIDQGSLMITANSVYAFTAAYQQSHDLRFKRAADEGLLFISSTKPETTQDKVFAILALSKYGTPLQRKLVPGVVEQLKKEQHEDGGWGERSDMQANAYATGQVLYAFKQAGESIETPEFEHGVRFLLTKQKDTGAWPSMNSQSGRPSEFAPTMWTVIGLAGSFRQAKTTEVTQEADRIRISMQGAILFDFDKYDLKPEAEAVLEQIKSSIIDQHPNANLVVEGHTDDRGSVEYNLQLSQRRAESVANWLAKHGVDGARLQSKGDGKAKPKYPNDTEENRSRNRRVEISVLTGTSPSPSH